MNLPSAREPKIANLKITHTQITKLAAAAATGLALLGVFAASLHGQAALLQQRVAELKESTAKNKQALAQYTWVEKVTVYLKGEQKKTESFQVRMGPDGKPQKTPLGPAPAAQNDSGARGGGRLRQKKCFRQAQRRRPRRSENGHRQLRQARRFHDPALR
jgi:hypothetical protein